MSDVDDVVVDGKERGAGNMEMRLEQQPRQRQTQGQRQQFNSALFRQLVQTLEGVQAEQKEQAEINKNTAVALTEVVGRLKNVERWQDEADERRDRQEARRDSRDDQRPNGRRSDVAIIISACSVGIQVVSALIATAIIVAAHWR